MDTGLTNGDGRPSHTEGLYRQKETGAEMYLENKTPELGSPMIDAFVKGGWELVSEHVESKEAEVVSNVEKKEPTNEELRNELVGKGFDVKTVKKMNKTELLEQLAEVK